MECRKTFWQRFNSLHKEQVEETLQLFNLEKLSNRAISNLSGGQWQRTLLARAFVSRPDLLLLDEPETHLDEHSRAELYHIFEQYNKHCSFVVVSHDEHQFPHLPNRRIWHVEDKKVTERTEW